MTSSGQFLGSLHLNCCFLGTTTSWYCSRFSRPRIESPEKRPLTQCVFMYTYSRSSYVLPLVSRPASPTANLTEHHAQAETSKTFWYCKTMFLCMQSLPTKAAVNCSQNWSRYTVITIVPLTPCPDKSWRCDHSHLTFTV